MSPNTGIAQDSGRAGRIQVAEEDRNNCYAVQYTNRIKHLYIKLVAGSSNVLISLAVHMM